jgi:hypothetical protein
MRGNDAANGNTGADGWAWSGPSGAGRHFFIASLVPAALPVRVSAADIHVSPVGWDGNPGTLKAPLQSFAAAQKVARPFAGKEKVNVSFASGVYYLPETVVFTAADRTRFAANDVILVCNGKPVRTVTDIRDAQSAAAGGKLAFQVSRKQSRLAVMVDHYAK